MGQQKSLHTSVKYSQFTETSEQALYPNVFSGNIDPDIGYAEGSY